MKIATTMTTETITIVTVFENNDFSVSPSCLSRDFKAGFSVVCVVRRTFKVEVTGVDFLVLRSGKVPVIRGVSFVFALRGGEVVALLIVACVLRLVRIGVVIVDRPASLVVRSGVD